jgi:CubicO group peptidase (beta-lactamase class C family)
MKTKIELILNTALALLLAANALTVYPIVIRQDDVFVDYRTPAETVPQQSKNAEKGELKSKLDDYFSTVSAFGFSGSVMIVKEGETLLHKGYGFADRENSTPNAKETVFDIGSITKQFTAAAIMKLEMQGKLNTNDLLSKYLPDVPADKTGITLHQVLTHTAGLRNKAA